MQSDAKKGKTEVYRFTVREEKRKGKSKRKKEIK